MSIYGVKGSQQLWSWREISQAMIQTLSSVGFLHNNNDTGGYYDNIQTYSSETLELKYITYTKPDHCTDISNAKKEQAVFVKH